MADTLDFSVVISAYNKGQYLLRAINSVLSQTCADFEVLIVDDGSTDNTKEIVKSINDGRIKYIYQENSGLPACARNKGMKLSRGKYIALLDGDDYWHKDKLKICRSVFDSDPEIDVVYHNIAVVDGDKIARYSSFASYSRKMYESLLYGGNGLCPSAVVIKRGIVFDDKCLFDEDKKLFTIEDYEYWLRLASRYRFSLIKDCLGYYRVTSSGILLNNIEANTVNMLDLIDKHFLKDMDRAGCKLFNRIRIKKRRSAVINACGRMYHHKSLFRDSFRWYNKAFREYPLNLKSLAGMVFSFFRLKISYK